MPDTDDRISVTSEQVLTISRPSNGDGFWVSSLTGGGELWLELVNNLVLLQVEDLDGRSGGSSQPVSVWREGQSVDLVTSSKGVKSLLLLQVPQHDGTVLTSRGNQSSIWGDGDGGDVTGVTNVVTGQSVLVQVPRLFQKNTVSNIQVKRDDCYPPLLRRNCKTSEILVIGKCLIRSWQATSEVANMCNIM